MKNIRVFLSKNFQLLEMKFSIYLNRRVFAMLKWSLRAINTNMLCHPRPVSFSTDRFKAVPLL